MENNPNVPVSSQVAAPSYLLARHTRRRPDSRNTDEFRAPANQLSGRHITKEIDELMSRQGELSAFILLIGVAILTATIGEALLRLRVHGPDAEAVLRQAEALFENRPRQ